MKKTMNINIAGQLFRIDEDAYEILTRYLEHVSARFRTEQGGDETVSDIETRIAEIFGGGNEPPTLVSKEMVSDMINTMGAPEDYYDSASGSTGRSGSVSYTRKSMYDPNSPSARLGKALSEFFRAFGRVMSAILRIFAIIFGVIFTVIGFSLLFSFVLVLFFNNAPILSNLMEPEMTNIHTLLSIVLNSAMVTADNHSHCHCGPRAAGSPYIPGYKDDIQYQGEVKDGESDNICSVDSRSLCTGSIPVTSALCLFQQ